MMLRCSECIAVMPSGNLSLELRKPQCPKCYKAAGLATDPDFSGEIAVFLDGRWLRVFPHTSEDGHLAMRVLTNLHSYVLLPSGAIRMRPKDFVIPDGLPSCTVQQIERSFILNEPHAKTARAIFAAYFADDFEVVETAK